MTSYLDGKNVLVTGGTGSFGRAFVSQVLSRLKLNRLVIYSRDEMKQYEMAQVFSQERYPPLRYFIGDVRDVDRLEMAMRGIDVVIHAAALKHVPAAEYNPMECIRTNVHGAENVVAAALRCRVKRVVALSTDKAASPINLYGASKLASDKIMIAANNLAGDIGTRFSVVRYGNVLGSRGSVIPLFQKLIQDGAKELPITDPRMTRFWITLKNGVDFVLTCLDAMRGGEIFVPKIPSMKVADLASALGPGLVHKVVGIRPGEKLHEVMITRDDARMTIELPDYYVIQPAFSFWSGAAASFPDARPVSEDFEYTSSNNTKWLDAAALRDMLKAELGVAR
jgi:UDP-N-acetylglucosamine 4,6-dehydratase/5-epimerase